MMLQRDRIPLRYMHYAIVHVWKVLNKLSYNCTYCVTGDFSFISAFRLLFTG